MIVYLTDSELSQLQNWAQVIERLLQVIKTNKQTKKAPCSITPQSTKSKPLTQEANSDSMTTTRRYLWRSIPGRVTH